MPWCCSRTGVLGIRPRDGISRGNLAAFYICSSFNVCSFVVMAAAQPNLLRILLADDAEEGEGGRRSGGVVDGTENIGRVTGTFVLVAELTILACSGPWGVVSDIYGRRLVWSVGLMIMAIAFCLAPMAPSIPTLILVRALHSAGAAGAASMMTPVLLPAQELHSMAGMLAGMLPLVVTILSFAGAGRVCARGGQGQGRWDTGAVSCYGSCVRGVISPAGSLYGRKLLPSSCLPSDPNMAISAGYYVTAFIMVFASVFAFFCLHPEKPPHPPTPNAWVHGGAVFRNAYAWARDYALQVWDVLQDGVLVLALAASFAGRGDASAITSLLPVWIVEYMREVNGSTAAEAASRAGMVTGFIQLAALCFSFPVGLCSDAFGDVAAILAAGLAAAGAYASLASISDPTGSSALMLAVPLGIAEISVAITSQVIISRRGTPSKRGLLGAMFSVTSALGILFIGKVGGLLYDIEGPGAAFFVVAAMNFAVAVGAAFIWFCKGENRLVRVSETTEAREGMLGSKAREGEGESEPGGLACHTL